MDVSRAVLDNLMGRDRNKPNDKITERDHYSNPDVCKSFLVCFCFNTLFPNTTYDEGPCEKRHDTYLKTMFDNDPARAQYERQYIRECIHWIERRLQDVQKKTKQNQSVIDNKSNFPADRPKQILDRILAIEQDIQQLIQQSEKYGQEGRIDDSARCLEQVQKLRQRRKQIQLMGTDMTNAQKQQKICLICGAIQTINDTEKRIQTHLEGKIHQGFLKLRHEVENLKIRLQVLNKMNPPEKRQDHQERRKQEQQRKRQQQQRKQQKTKQPQNQRKEDSRQQRQKQREKQKEKQRQREPRQRSDSTNRKRRKERSRQRSRQRKHDDRDSRRSKDRRSRSKDKKQRKTHRDSKQRQRQREHKDRSHKDREHREKDHKDHKKKSKKNRSRSRQKDYPEDN